MSVKDGIISDKPAVSWLPIEPAGLKEEMILNDGLIIAYLQEVQLFFASTIFKKLILRLHFKPPRQYSIFLDYPSNPLIAGGSFWSLSFLVCDGNVKSQMEGSD